MADAEHLARNFAQTHAKGHTILLGGEFHQIGSVAPSGTTTAVTVSE
jgi:hypothetical protein